MFPVKETASTMTDSPNPNENPYSASQADLSQPQPAGDQEGDVTGGVIPYKNPHALIGYYVGYAGLLPVIGIPFAIAAICLGIMGLKKRRANPVIRGSGHAVFAIIAGCLGLLCGAGVLLMFSSLAFFD